MHSCTSSHCDSFRVSAIKVGKLLKVIKYTPGKVNFPFNFRGEKERESDSLSSTVNYAELIARNRIKFQMLK